MEKENENVTNEPMVLPDHGGVEVSRKLGESEGEDHQEPLEEAEHTHQIDYHSLSKKEIVELLKEAAKGTDYKRWDVLMKECKQHFDEMRNREREEALQRFLEQGGKRDDFEYRLPELDVAFDANYKLLRDKRNQHYREIEEQKNANLFKKTELLEKLRALVDSEDTEHSFHAFKELQREWKNTGAVPNAQVKTLWANYSALVDRFYDNRSIYFELKELDRKKNLESKFELCARAEKLIDVERLSEAVRELNELHNEFKHVGPVPLDEKEAVWARFKAASDAVYRKRDEYLEKVNKELAGNLEKKLKLADEVAVYGAFRSDRIKEWNQKTQEILALQKQWEAAGPIPRSKAKEVNKKFWAAFKGFFSAKNAFFKKLDEERGANLKLKEELIQQAEALKASSDWESTADALKTLQSRWKEIGPVPEKVREKVYQRFKEACDYFFDQRRGQQDKQDAEQQVNLEQKEAVCAALEAAAAQKTGSREELAELSQRFNAAGFVPKKAIHTIKDRFQRAVSLYLASLDGLTEQERESMSLEAEMESLKNDPQAERKLYHREQHIRKRITKAENDLAVLKNNLEFFARSKNADKLREEFNLKISEASDHLTTLKKQLKMLKSVS